MSDFLLSLFPGIGLLDAAFESEGFCIVRGPDALWGGDIKNFHPPAGKFDGIIGGPPCQRFSRLRHIILHNGHELAEDLIPEFVRIVAEAAPNYFLMENVEDAPVPLVPNYNVHSFLLNNRWLGEVQNRMRRFSFGVRAPREIVDLTRWIQPAALENIDYERAVTASRGGCSVPVKLNRNGEKRKRMPGSMKRRSLSEICSLQGFPENFLDEAPFTDSAKRKVLGNGVPLAMGKTLAQAIKKYLEGEK